jgi:hypothetical protein
LSMLSDSSHSIDDNDMGAAVDMDLSDDESAGMMDKKNMPGKKFKSKNIHCSNKYF